MVDRRKALLNDLSLKAFGLGQRLFLMQDVAATERRGALFGEIAFRVLKSRRNRTISNLELAFPEWTDRQRHEVARKVFRHFGLVTADFMRTPLRTNAEVLVGVETEGSNHVDDAFSVGKGVIACTAHFGNWERFGHWMIATGRPLSVVARDANQGGVQLRVQQLREMTGMTVLSRGSSVRPILTKLKQKEAVAMLPDQNSDEAYVPFFGKMCGTVLGPGVLHKRTGAPVVSAYCIRVGVGRYKIVIREPIDMENKIDSPEEIMRLVQADLEAVIRQYPEQWLWMHDRWKNARKNNLL